MSLPFAAWKIEPKRRCSTNAGSGVFEHNFDLHSVKPLGRQLVKAMPKPLVDASVPRLQARPAIVN
ncbi:hypothetical protein CH251_02900 [Rhodococcus sp. 06-462-5]|nr:hypothetical protein CH251_02900 [Rhodococcus sp. 06-462-5]OZE62019.1 hypothetical protein CH270_20275 [Rhodococcus sp. 02-925g]